MEGRGVSEEGGSEGCEVVGQGAKKIKVMQQKMQDDIEGG